MKPNYNIIATILFFALNSAFGLNILAIYPYQGKSHFLVYRVLLRELANRGHNVTVISHFPEEYPPNNYHDISLAGSVNAIEGDPSRVLDRSYLSIIMIGLNLSQAGTENCEVMLANSQVQSLFKQMQKFDVAVVEQFNSDCALGLAYKLAVPVVGTTSNALMPHQYKSLGVPYNPSYVSFLFLEGGTKPTLYQRLERVVFDAYFRAIYYLVSQRGDQKTLSKYFDIPPLDDLAREVKFLLVYHHFVLTGSKLFPANVIEVGGYHVDKAKPLSRDLRKFVEEAEYGVIYISFGSIVNAASFPSQKIAAVLESMKEFPQRFIWKWENGSLTTDKNKLYVASWLPQVDILGHPKTLAFFSHGGMGSTTESLHFGVPLIAMPILGDQPSNGAAIEESGFGIQVHYRDLTKENLVAAIKKVLQPNFRDRAKKLSAAWHDRPMSPLDTAVFWTEFAARHSNFTFRTAAADVSAYQYLNLDIACIFTILILSFLLIIKLLCCRSKTNDTETLTKLKTKNRNVNNTYYNYFLHFFNFIYLYTCKPGAEHIGLVSL